jgi:hypothetical protein
LDGEQRAETVPLALHLIPNPREGGGDCPLIPPPPLPLGPPREGVDLTEVTASP